MPIGMRLEVHFHQQDQASVLVESSTPVEDERSGEILLFVLFAARMLVNLGAHDPVANSLAELLSELEDYDGDDYDDDYDNHDDYYDKIRQLIHHESPAGPRLVDYQGAKGRKGFLAVLELTGDNKLSFTVKPWGFGLRARGTGYYAPNSVILLLRKLALGREAEDDFIHALGYASGMVALSHTHGDLSVASQEDEARLAWKLSVDKFIPDPDN